MSSHNSAAKHKASPRTNIARAGKLVWLPVLIGIVGFFVVAGTPHMLVTYVWTGDRDNKTYLSCDYVGRFGRSVVPTDGKCPLVVFFAGPEEK